MRYSTARLIKAKDIMNELTQSRRGFLVGKLGSTKDGQVMLPWEPA
jgi:hypothetical protein